MQHNDRLNKPIAMFRICRNQGNFPTRSRSAHLLLFSHTDPFSAAVKNCRWWETFPLKQDCDSWQGKDTYNEANIAPSVTWRGRFEICIDTQNWVQPCWIGALEDAWMLRALSGPVQNRSVGHVFNSLLSLYSETVLDAVFIWKKYMLLYSIVFF